MNIQLEEGVDYVWVDPNSVESVGDVRHVYKPENWFTRLLGFEDLDYYKYYIYTRNYQFEIVRSTYEEAVADRERALLILTDKENV